MNNDLKYYTMNKTITASLIHRDSETKVLSLVGHFDVSKFDVREDALEYVFEATQNIEKPGVPKVIDPQSLTM